jgi:hypothetical protein
VSHEGQVVGFNQATSWAWTPSALSQRDRGMPLPADVRRTLGRTKGRPGVQSTICLAPTRSTACTPAWTRRARWAEEHKPRLATSTSPGCQLGWTACTRARSWVRRGATTSFRSTPVPAWNSPRSRATGKPHPGRCAVGWPKAACKAAVSGMEHPSPRPKPCDGHATVLRPRRIAAPRCRSAPGGGQRSATGVWRGLDSMPPHGTASPTDGADGCRRCCHGEAVTGRAASW